MNDPRGSDRQFRDEHIVSAANPAIKLARSLQRRRIRQRERAILVEGVRAILTAMERGTRIQTLLIDAARQDRIPDSDLSLMRAAATRVLFVEPQLYATLADTEHPQAALAICDMPLDTLPADCSLVLALDGVRDPGNLGTLIRSAAGAGADGVALLPGTVDRFNGKAIRSSAGAVFSLPVAPFPGLGHVIEQCFATRPLVIVADGTGPAIFTDVDWTEPTILVIGGEAEGATSAARSYADIVARIPLDPAVESLNAAMAGAVMLFEARRQRGQSR